MWSQLNPLMWSISWIRSKFHLVQHHDHLIHHAKASLKHFFLESHEGNCPSLRHRPIRNYCIRGLLASEFGYWLLKDLRSIKVFASHLSHSFDHNKATDLICLVFKKFIIYEIHSTIYTSRVTWKHVRKGHQRKRKLMPEDALVSPTKDWTDRGKKKKNGCLWFGSKVWAQS